MKMDSRKHPLSQRETFTQKQAEAMYHALCAVRDMTVNTEIPPNQQMLEEMWGESETIYRHTGKLLEDIDSNAPMEVWLPVSHIPEPPIYSSSDNDDDLPF